MLRLQDVPRLHTFASLLAVLTFVIPIGAVQAQQTGDPPAAPAKPGPPSKAKSTTKTSTSKSANVKSGEITGIDGDNLTLKEKTGKSAVYVLTAKTHYTKTRRAAQLSDFKAPDTVVVHFRKSRTDGALLVTEMADPASWAWLAELRKTTTAAVITEITEDTLSVTVGVEAIPLTYTISDKTRWAKNGKDVTAEEFKPNDKVYVVPRSLPGGTIMARAVADTNAGAAQEKERTATSVHGTILSVEPDAHKIAMKTLAGDTRNLAYNDETEVMMSSKPLPLTSLKAGQHIGARLRHEEGGDELAWRITIETSTGRKPAATRKPSAASPKKSGTTGTTNTTGKPSTDKL